MVLRAQLDLMNEYADDLLSAPPSSPFFSEPHIELKAFHYRPPSYPHVFTVIYPLLASGAQSAESYLAPLRAQLHKKLFLPPDRPLIRINNAIEFRAPTDAHACEEDEEPLAKKKQSTRLVDVHKAVGKSGVTGGTLHMVDGSYEYYHYMQDNFDDKGWGCAYRSMQTICSWMKLQNYTQLPVPSHREIQKLLVEIDFSKPKSFIGSSEWIGAIEIQFCLEKLYGVSCKILNVSSGADLEYRGSELAYHFDKQGTPVMIGGGKLAYTLLGVDYNSQTGQIKFLILDPHYTGSDDVNKIVQKGWCGWKGAELFQKSSFYNLCMPQRPKGV